MLFDNIVLFNLITYYFVSYFLPHEIKKTSRIYNSSDAYFFTNIAKKKKHHFSK